MKENREIFPSCGERKKGLYRVRFRSRAVTGEKRQQKPAFCSPATMTPAFFLSSVSFIRDQVQQLIDTLPSTLERQILEDRYLLFMKWEEIAEATNFSTKYAQRIARDAIPKLAPICAISSHDKPL